MQVWSREAMLGLLPMVYWKSWECHHKQDGLIWCLIVRCLPLLPSRISRNLDRQQRHECCWAMALEPLNPQYQEHTSQRVQPIVSRQARSWWWMLTTLCTAMTRISWRSCRSYTYRTEFNQYRHECRICRSSQPCEFGCVAALGWARRSEESV